MKKCRKCKEYKVNSDFKRCKNTKGGLSNKCRSCLAYKRKTVAFNSISVKPNHKYCTKCHTELDLSMFSKNKNSKDGLQYHCKNCANKKSSEHYFKNPSKKINYRTENIIKLREYSRLYLKKRREQDYLFKMKSNLRSRTKSAFKAKGYKKSSKTQEMLGVDWEVCKAHIEKQFTEGMNWDNQGKWHIDHIIPLALAKNEEELMKLCHYRNLQPLWAEDNFKKSDKLQGQQTYFKL